MKEQDKNKTMGKYFEALYPFVFAVLGLLALIYFKVDYTMPKFEKVLDGAITFSSIVVGFLGALLGILISIKSSAIVNEIFRTNERNTLKRYFYEPFLLGIVVVVSSGVLHVLSQYDGIIPRLTFYLWSFSIIWFIPSTFRVVNTFMSVFFVSNSTPDRPQSNVEKDPIKREELRERLRKQAGEYVIHPSDEQHESDINKTDAK
jgi:hypothetical protein